MKNHKHSQKEAAKFFESELNDDYLEPLEKGNDGVSSITKHLNSRKLQDQDIEEDPQVLRNLKHNSAQPQVHAGAKKIDLTDSVIGECVAGLGQDAKDCLDGLQSFRRLKNKEVKNAFKDVFDKICILPTLYLSTFSQKNGDGENESENIKAVYVWQMTRYSPCKMDGMTSVVNKDTRCKVVQTKNFDPSFFLLAKIVPEENEEIIEATFVQDTKLLVKSKTVDESNTTTIVYRVYLIKSFVHTFVVNPVMKDALANRSYSWKITLSTATKEDTIKYLKVNLYQKNLLHELNPDSLEATKIEEDGSMVIEALDILVQTQYSPNSPDEKDVSSDSFSELIDFPTSNQPLVVLFDKQSSRFLHVQKGEIHVIPLLPNQVHSYHYNANIFVYFTQKGEIYHFDLDFLLALKVEKVNHSILDFTKDFEWKLVDLPDLFSAETTPAIIYLFNDKFYVLKIYEPDSPPMLVLDVREQQTSEQPIHTWTCLSTQNPLALFIVYITKDNISVNNIQNSQTTLQRIYYPEYLDPEWKLQASSEETFYITDQTFQCGFYYEYDLGNSLEWQESKWELHAGKYQVQIEGRKGDIRLATNQPILVNKLDFVYSCPPVREEVSQRVQIIRQEREKKEKEKEIERKKEESKREIEKVKDQKDKGKVKHDIGRAKNMEELDNVTKETLGELKSRVKEETDKKNNQYKEKMEAYEKMPYKFQRNNEKPQKEEISDKDVNLYKEIQAEKKQAKKTLLKEMNKEKDKKKKDRRSEKDYD